MGAAYKVLSQANPSANSLTSIYTVPAATSTVISTVCICNQSTTAATFSLAVQPTGASISSKNYLTYNTPLSGSDMIALTLGITLGNTDVFSANVSSPNVSISLFGSELS
jgi:hypothetical protein